MNTTTTIKLKVWVMLIAGPLFALFPIQVIELMGASLETPAYS